MKGDKRCVEGRLLRHDPQFDDPYLETDVGQCPDCGGAGCEEAMTTDDELLALARKARDCYGGGAPWERYFAVVKDPSAIIALIERHRADVERLTKERDEARDDAFSLAANQCHEGYAGEHGDHMCRVEDRAKAAESALAAERKRCGELEEALNYLANAADAVGVKYFDTDTMSDEVVDMQTATLAARAALAGKDARVTDEQRVKE